MDKTKTEPAEVTPQEVEAAEDVIDEAIEKVEEAGGHEKVLETLTEIRGILNDLREKVEESGKIQRERLSAEEREAISVVGRKRTFLEVLDSYFAPAWGIGESDEGSGDSGGEDDRGD